MDKRLALMPLLLVANTSLSGCIAAAIPAIAGSAMAGSRVLDDDRADEAAPTVAVAPPPVAPPAMAPAVIAPPPAPAPELAPRIVPAPVTAPAPVIPAPAPTTKPVVTEAAAPSAAPALRPEPVAPAVAATSPVSTASVPRVAPVPSPRAPASYPDPSNPLSDEQLSFARFVRYGQASALGAQSGADLTSAMLSDPIAIDGKRRRCSAGEQQVVVIDLDPQGGVFVPPANPAEQPGLALGLAVLREAGVEIAWLSEMTTDKSGALRTALERSGLDPRGEDIISLGRDSTDSKQKRKDNLAGITCIIAIAGDERADFDERFKYLRSPEAGAELEPLIGDGWFLIAPLLGTQGQ